MPRLPLFMCTNNNQEKFNSVFKNIANVLIKGLHYYRWVTKPTFGIKMTCKRKTWLISACYSYEFSLFVFALYNFDRCIFVYFDSFFTKYDRLIFLIINRFACVIFFFVTVSFLAKCKQALHVISEALHLNRHTER